VNQGTTLAGSAGGKADEQVVRNKIQINKVLFISRMSKKAEQKRGRQSEKREMVN
jgi:hypothetical protein